MSGFGSGASKNFDEAAKREAEELIDAVDAARPLSGSTEVSSALDEIGAAIRGIVNSGPGADPDSNKVATESVVKYLKAAKSFEMLKADLC